MSSPAVPVVSPTETVNPRTGAIDEVPTVELLRLLNAEDAVVPDAVEAVLPQLAALVDEAVRRVSAGGRVHYFGAGTSGRLAVLDAAELPPTFGVDPDSVVVASSPADRRRSWRRWRMPRTTTQGATPQG
jgi:N-acetylmuramic acid 6-phosphate etherase